MIVNASFSWSEMDINNGSGTEGAKHYIELLRNQPSAGFNILTLRLILRLVQESPTAQANKALCTSLSLAY